MSDAPVGLSRVERLLPALERLAGARLRVWRSDGRAARPVAGPAVEWTPPGGLNGGQGEGEGEGEGEREGERGRAVETPEGTAWFEPVTGVAGFWLELRGAASGERGRELAGIVGAVLEAERDATQVAAELSERYEEIDLIYTISEILGHTIRLDEAAQRIVREVSTVVRAQRATLLTLDEERRVLKIVAARGMDAKDIEPIEVDDPYSVAARVFREGKIVSYDPGDPTAASPGSPAGRGYRGKAFLSVPVLYAAPGRPARPIGVINLTDRLGEDAFSAGDRKLVAAIANQIGAAIENASLVARDLSQQRVRRELELAHDLQLKLLPSPLVIAARADVAARCRPAESVGGDFYNLLNLHDGRVGVMIGDVTSHGFGSALIMALTMAAAGIHAESTASPAEVLVRLEQSVADELASTEMFLTLFYGVIDPKGGRLAFANAGHAHAFVVDGDSGTAARLDATRPPMGLASEPGRDVVRPWRRRKDILCLFTDGLADALSEQGARFGEQRVVGHVTALRERPAREILEAIFADVAAFTGGGPASDDRTLVLLRV